MVYWSSVGHSPVSQKSHGAAHRWPRGEVAELENPIPGVGAAYRFGTAISGTPGDQSPGDRQVIFMKIEQKSVNLKLSVNFNQSNRLELFVMVPHTGKGRVTKCSRRRA